MNERSESNLEFSVIIGTFNGDRKLAKALQAISQQVTSHSYEVIVVDDASTDGTMEVASKFDVRIVSLSQNQGHGAALNAGLAHAKGRIVALMDDDCVPPSNWIEQLSNAWSTAPSSTSVIGGLVEPLEMNTWNRRYVAVRRPLVHQEEVLNESANFFSRLKNILFAPHWNTERRSVYFTVGANMSILTSRAIEVGGFTSERGAGEEESIARPLRAVYGTATVELDPGIVMFHDFAPTLTDSFRRARSYGRASGRDWYRDRDIPSIPPRPVIVTIVGLALVPLIGIWALVTVVPMTLLLYRSWAAAILKMRSIEILSYPFLQLFEEMISIVGFVEGVHRSSASKIGAR
jgi:glycosyltransferase involved in cell wall biosynthesis